MSASNDIRSLFKQFGGEADHYQEFNRDEGGRSWPFSSAPAPSPAPSRSVLTSAPVPARPPVVEPVEPREAPNAEATDWSAAGLRNLLAKLADNPLPEPVVKVPAEQQRPSLEHLQIISVLSAKGGVGKTTLAANLASALRRAGRPVIALDLDPQNALHHHFQPAESQASELEVSGIAQAGEPWLQLGKRSDDGVFVLPHGLINEDSRPAFEQNLLHDPLWLARHLAAMDLAEGTLVVLDTPPGPSVYLRQALSVANLALGVSLADPASYTSLPQVDRLIGAYTKGREDFAGAAYLINQVDHSRQLNKDIAQILRGLLGNKLIGVVHRDPSISEALAYNRNVLAFDPNGRGCHDILDCAQALIGRLSVADAALQ